jgi:hypothetical protein
MKRSIKRPRKLMRIRNRERINRIKNQHFVFAPLAPLFLLVLIKWDLGNSSAETILARLRLYILKLTGNADFLVINPTLVQLQTMADALALAIDKAKSGDRDRIEDRDILQVQAEDMIRELAWDIQKKSDGDAQKIHSTGFPTRKGKSPSAIPGQVINLTAKANGEGKIKLRWKKMPGALGYFIQASTQIGNPGPPPIPNWELVGKSYRVTFDLDSLTPGTMYYFRVYASNQLGDGEKSEIANSRCG